MSATPQAAIVYVHGLFLRGAEAFPLRRQLLATGRYQWHRFPYFSTLSRISAIADALHEFVAAIDAPVVHWLGHSLGGVVVQRCFERHPRQRPGRAVFLGTPSQASRVALAVARLRLGRLALGHVAVAELLADQHRRWTHSTELGLIAGTRPVGLGRLLTRFDGPNDGTVSVAETRLPGASAQLTLPVTHMGLIWSSLVAVQVDRFLQSGRFGT